jgi:hypothetical protein
MLFLVVEDKLGPVVQKVSADLKRKGIELEREATKRNAVENNKNVTIVEGRVDILTVLSDTHWPRRGDGKKYVSPSGLTYMIGSLTGKIIGSHVCSQDCHTCHYFEKKLRMTKRILVRLCVPTNVIDFFENQKSKNNGNGFDCHHC